MEERHELTDPEDQTSTLSVSLFQSAVFQIPMSFVTSLKKFKNTKESDVTYTSFIVQIIVSITSKYICIFTPISTTIVALGI